MATARKDGWFFEQTSTKDRFVAGDEPTQATYEDLIASKTSKLDENSKATTSQQGLVKMATSVDIENKVSPDAKASYAVKPENLPLTKEADYVAGDVPKAIEVTESFNQNKNIYSIGLLGSFKTWLFERLIPITTGSLGEYLAKGANNTVEWKTLSDYAVIPDGQPNELILGDKTLADKYSALGVDGGTTSQVLAKVDGTTGNYGWKTLDTDIAGGTTGQVLKKNSATDGDYSFADESVANTYTFDSNGATNSLVSSATTTNGFKTKGIGIDVASTSNKATISSDGDDVFIKVDKSEGDDLLVVETSINWGAMGSPSLNTFYGWMQHVVDTVNSKT